MNYKTLAGKIGIGLVAGGLTLWGLSEYNSKETNRPTHIYSLDANNDSNEHDDILIGFESNKSVKLYLRNSEGKLESIELIRQKDKNKDNKWYEDKLGKVDTQFRGLRSKLDKLTN